MTEKTIFLPPDDRGGRGQADYRLTLMVPKRRYFTYLRERWWMVLVCVVLAVGATTLHETMKPESYTSFAQLYLTGNVQMSVPALFTEESQNYFGTQMELLKSARLRNAAYQRIGYQLNGVDSDPIRLEVAQPLKTSILLLQATGADPALTQRFLQALIDEYLAYKDTTRLSSAEDLVVSFTEELTKREKDLHTEQDRLAEFQASNNVAVIQEEGKSAGMNLADLNLQLARLKLERRLLQNGIEPVPAQSNATTADKESFQSGAESAAGDKGSDHSANLAVGDTSLKALRVQLALMRAQKESGLARGVTAERAIEGEIGRLTNTIALLERQDREQKQLDLHEVEQRIAAIEATIPEWEKIVLEMNARVSQSQRLNNNIHRQQDYYDHLLTTLQSVDLGKNMQQERLSLLQPPTPGQLAKNYFVVRLGLAGVAGVLVSLAVVFVWYLADDRFVSVHDIRDQFGENVLGLVPRIRVAASKPGAVLVQPEDDRAAYAESYRHLRSALLLSANGKGRPQSLLLTSAVAGEGKTTVAANLSRVLARSGFKVLLVDMDPHGGGLHRILGQAQVPGLSEYLRGAAEQAVVFRNTEIPGLCFIPAGGSRENADDLLLRPGFEGFLKAAKVEYDFVILDAPPILAADDAALLVPQADAIVVVARSFFTKSKLMRRALDMLYQRQAKEIEIVLNGARADDWVAYGAANGIASGKNGSKKTSMK